MQVHITTEDFPSDVSNEKVVIIMNHRTRLDWLYYWSVIMRQGKLENEKIILKSKLKHIPGAGIVIILSQTSAPVEPAKNEGKNSQWFLK